MKKRYDVQKDSYDDILHLPHHQSKIHPHMTIHDRAAQFAPFSALTGHEAALKETARRTNDFVKLDEYEKAALDTKLQFLRKHLLSHPKIQVTWFCPDEKKDGGIYRTKTCVLKSLNEYKKQMIFMDETEIPIKYVSAIEGEIFQKMY